MLLCRRLECTWMELQEMPEDTIAVWQAVLEGEDHAAREKNALMK